MKILYFDLETTGLKFWKNGIHQIAGMVEIDGEIKETFDFKVRPYEKAIIEPKALEVAGVTSEQISQYEPMPDVYLKIKTMLSKYVDKYQKQDKFFLCGYNNASFDNPFFRAFFVQNGDNYFGSWFWSGALDVMVLAFEYLKDKRDAMPNFQLHTVAKELGIAVDDSKLHDALYDIEITKAIYEIVKR